MSSQQVPPTTSSTDGGIFENLARNYKTVSIVLGVLALPTAAIPIVAAELHGWDALPVIVWGIVFIGILVLSSVLSWYSGSPERQLTDANRLRLSFLVLLGGFGVATAALGIVLPFSTPHYREVFSGGMKVWRANGWMLFRVGAAIVGGLVLIFIGLQLARTWERSSTIMRRLMYGYNAVLTSILLILIVGLINLLPYSGVQPFSRANEAIDWTRTGIHTLHPAMKSQLAELKQPVKVYVLGSSNDRVMFEMTALLDKCRAIDPQLTWEQLSRDRNRTAILELIEKYQIAESEGVLVVYGSEGNAVHEFIKRNDLFEEKMGAEPGQHFVFKGENALLNALTFLSSGKKKATVYFTQGNGELEFSERRDDRIDVGMGALIDELNRINYDARELKVAADTDKVPEDADILVIARPREEFPAKFVTALRDYLKGTNRKENKKGKLIVLFDVVQRGGKGPMVKTGLEALVADYGVRVGDNRVLDPSSRDPLLLTAVSDPRGRNPIALAFANESEGASLFLFYKARTVEAAQKNPAAPAAPSVDNLIVTYPSHRVLVDTDLDAAPTALIRDLLRGDPQQADAKLTKAPMPLAVTVSEGKAQAPPVPGHDFMAREGEPRLVVFGDASWISNSLLEQVAPTHFNLFASSLSWTAGRSDIGTRVPPTQHDLYRLKAPPDSGWRLVLLPGFLMVLGVLALGLGVWVVRRR